MATEDRPTPGESTFELIPVEIHYQIAEKIPKEQIHEMRLVSKTLADVYSGVIFKEIVIHDGGVKGANRLQLLQELTKTTNTNSNLGRNMKKVTR